MVGVKDCFITVESHVITSWIVMMQPSLKMTTAQVVETSVTVNNNSPIQALRSPGRSNSTYFWNDSWVQTFHTDENLSYSLFHDLYYSKKPWRNLQNFESSLQATFGELIFIVTICLFCTRCLKERRRKVNLSDRISYALRFSFSLMYSNTQFGTKHSFNLGLRQ